MRKYENFLREYLVFMSLYFLHANKNENKLVSLGLAQNNVESFHFLESLCEVCRVIRLKLVMQGYYYHYGAGVKEMGTCLFHSKLTPPPRLRSRSRSRSRWRRQDEKLWRNMQNRWILVLIKRWWRQRQCPLQCSANANAIANAGVARLTRRRDASGNEKPQVKC